MKVPKETKHFVLIRGLLREARHWGIFTEYLQQQFPDAVVTTPDIPGNGRYHQLTSPASIASMAEALREQIPRDQSAVLIGLSMGGMVAIDWMSRYPEEISGAVLINTSARPLAPFYHRLRWQIYPQILTMVCCSPEEKEAEILRLTSNHFQHDATLLQNWRQWQRQNPVSGISARNQLLAALKFRLPTNRPQSPILIVTSAADRLVDYRCSLQLARYWQTSYRQHETAGHDLPLDEPEWLAHVIVQWCHKQITP
ncbi:MAG: alpha/beta hydrolase [Nitrosomonas sp.]